MELHNAEIFNMQPVIPGKHTLKKEVCTSDKKFLLGSSTRRSLLINTMNYVYLLWGVILFFHVPGEATEALTENQSQTYRDKVQWDRALV